MKWSQLFFEDGDGPERRKRIPVAVDAGVDDVIVFPDVTSVVGFVAVSVVAVRTPRAKI